jgi:WXG100 family type VII secretion target
MAVAGEVTVNRAAMVTAANQIDEALGQIRSQQARLDSAHSTLVGSWKGEASSAFTNAFVQFNEDFGIVVRALDAMREKLIGTHQNYNTVEAANQQGMSKIAQALSGS